VLLEVLPVGFGATKFRRIDDRIVDEIDETFSCTSFHSITESGICR
jgi:hypothetical protein